MVICTTCSVFVADTDKVTHFKSDWHVYNLKRVVASLPPISKDAFDEKKASFTNESDALVDKKTYCQACKRSFLNNKSFEAHLNSGKHIKNAKSIHVSNGFQKNRSTAHTSNQHLHAGTELSDTDSLEQDTRAPNAIPIGQCLLCDKRFTDQSPSSAGDENQRLSLAHRTLAHMSDVHQFTVPYADKLVDPAGLLLELGRIVGEERACLHCGRQFYGSRYTSGNATVAKTRQVSLMSVRNHMHQKDGHLQLWCGTEDPVELALALAQAEEAQQLDSREDRFVPPAVTLVGGELFSQFYDQSVMAPSFLLPDADDETYEARLPSGTVIGHRMMQIVYRQHLSSSLALADPHLAGCRGAPLASLSGERLSLPASRNHQSSALQLATRRSIPMVSRASERRCKEWKQRWDMLIGQRGNMVNRMHIRRQY